MANNTQRGQKCFISEEDIASVLTRYNAPTILALLKEVAQYPDVKLDWNVLVKKTKTGITNAAEYHKLWRHLAYNDKLPETVEEELEEQTLDDEDSDLEYELEAFPPATDEALLEAAACVKVLLASGLSDDAGTIEAPLTINIPSWQDYKSPLDDPLLCSLKGINITVPVYVQKQSSTAIDEASLEAAGCGKVFLTSGMQDDAGGGLATVEDPLTIINVHSPMQCSLKGMNITVPVSAQKQSATATDEASLECAACDKVLVASVLQDDAGGGSATVEDPLNSNIPSWQDAKSPLHYPLLCSLNITVPVSEQKQSATATDEASLEAAVCDKVLLASVLQDDAGGSSTLEDPLAINIPSWQDAKSPLHNPQQCSLKGMNTPVLVSEQKQSSTATDGASLESAACVKVLLASGLSDDAGGGSATVKDPLSINIPSWQDAKSPLQLWTATDEASLEAATCDMVLLASGLQDDAAGGPATVEDPLSINIPSWQDANSPVHNPQQCSLKEMNTTVPVSAQKQSASTVFVTNAEGLDGAVTNAGSKPAKRKRKTSKAWTAEVKTAEGLDGAVSNAGSKPAKRKRKTSEKTAEGLDGAVSNAGRKPAKRKRKTSEPWTAEVKIAEGLDGAVPIAGSKPAKIKNKTSKAWTAEEDNQIIAGVKKFGEKNWGNILKTDFKGSRTAAQLAKRWSTIRKRKYTNIKKHRQLEELTAERLATNQAVSLALSMPIYKINSLSAASVIPNPMVQAAAVAAGARIATPSMAKSLIKAAQSKKSSTPGVHYICTGLSSASPTTYSTLVPSVSLPEPTPAAICKVPSVSILASASTSCGTGKKTIRVGNKLEEEKAQNSRTHKEVVKPAEMIIGC